MSDEETLTTACCAPLTSLNKPIEVSELGHLWLTDKHSRPNESNAFFQWPLPGPLLFINESSDARDHCANERTFLSYLRLSIYMAIVSVAITVSFHINRTPSELERQVAKPLGAVFWVLSVVTLALGAGNYIRTVNLYGRRAAIVQSGWKTQIVLGIIATSIIGTCIILLVIDKVRQR
ncbi:hypothetical protein BBK36DRAFT_1175115 [Trichoderma citrinoviride]|uniref:DUF202 domain-containing protein n=1 Tax=Trichoderma citrinoviride TaxID=58853 RepID=A0A2T4BMY9_9HYPO|nr:hypothetical protein BBK36DRAFT_1175115 [Trichoderma citrinoviride]PTB70672.1 hypothetical protein BBK36DRAFT_1175115 [Trichoderma citrinoviride]